MDKPLRDYGDEAWDRFFDFLADGIDEMPIEDVRRELREAGADTKRAVERVREAIERHRSRHGQPHA